MDSLIEDGVSLASQESKKIKTSNLQSGDANGSVPPVPAIKLCEDELSLIFRNCCITSKDLLNFRLVNKSWRNTATGILLQRDACSVHVSLNRTQQNAGGAEVADFQYYRDRLNVGNDEDKQILLTEFVKLAIVMKNSPKFPSSRLCIYSSYSSSTNYHDYLDLALFFAHHREKIKTICPSGSVTKKNLHGILFLFTPQLECLDLSEANLISSALDNKDDNTYNWDSKLPLLRSLILGKTNNSGISHGIMRLLLASPSNIRCIKGVNLINLPDVLEAEKGHVTSCFTFIYSTISAESHVNDTHQSVLLMNEFSEKSPKLSKLVLVIESSDFYLETLLSLNKIIRSSKDTLKDLGIVLHNFNLNDDPDALLHIPPMLSLESITLDIGLHCFTHPLHDLRLGLNEGRNLFLFEDHNSGDKLYFPSLAKVGLIRHQVSQDPYVEQNIFCFFRKLLDKNGTNSTKSHYCPRVKTLVLNNCNLPHISFMSRLSDVFPNIRDLQVKFFMGLVNTSDSNSVSLWLQCPSVELIEIYDICIPIHITDDLTSIFDAFFTGFSLVMCQKLRRKELPQVMDNPETLEFLRTTPSVCELEYLKELKMQFSSTFSSEFASEVTGLYAFSKMKNTKFVVSYNPILWKQNMQRRNYGQEPDYDDNDDGDEAAAAADDEAAANDEVVGTAENDKNEDLDIDVLCFGSLKPYVYIEHYTQNV